MTISVQNAVTLSYFKNYFADKLPDNVNQVCRYCFQIFLPGNYRVRLKPKPKLTPHVEKLLKKERKNYKLNLKQTKLLKRYKTSTNVQVRSSFKLRPCILSLEMFLTK